MINFLKQSLLFITANLANARFKYFFLIINIIPLVLYFFFEFPAENLIFYFILETIVYCFMHMIYIKLLGMPVVIVRILLMILSLVFIALAVYFIPSWNKDEPSENSIAFWNYAAILFSFYTIKLFTIDDLEFFEWDEKILKKNVVYKFGILAFVAILGTVLSRYVKSDVAFLISMIGIKTIIDLSVLQKHRVA